MRDLITFKKAFNLAHTSPNKALLINESIATISVVGSHAIPSQKAIPIPPNTLWDNDRIAEKVLLPLVAIDGTDSELGIHGYRAKLPDNYESLSTSWRVGDDYWVNGQFLSESEGTIQIIGSSLYGLAYVPKVYDSVMNVVDPLSCGLILYEFGGVVYIESPQLAAVPAFIECWIYIGYMQAEVNVYPTAESGYVVVQPSQIIDQGGGFLLMPHVFKSNTITVYRNGLPVFAENEDGFLVSDQRHIQLKDPVLPGEWFGVSYVSLQMGADIWHVPGASWYLGSNLIGTIWYQTHYDGTDIEGALAAVWEPATAGIYPIPTFTYLPGSDEVLVSDAGIGDAIGYYKVGIDINGAPSYNYDRGLMFTSSSSSSSSSSLSSGASSSSSSSLSSSSSSSTSSSAPAPKSITSYAETIFESAGVSFLSVCEMDSTHAIVCYTDLGNSNYGTAVCLTLSGTTITVGAPVIFESASTSNISVCKMDSTHAIVCYTDNGNSGYATARCITLSGTTVSYGIPQVFESASSSHMSVCMMDSTHAIVCCTAGVNNYGISCCLTLSGTTVSSWSAITYNAAATAYNSVCMVDATHAVVCYRNTANSNRGTTNLLTLSGTTITSGAPVVFTNTNTYQTYCCALDSSSILVGFSDASNSYYGNVCILTLSGGTLTAGSSVVFSSVTTYYAVVNRIDSGNAIVCYRDYGNTLGSAVCLLVSGGVVTVGTPTTFNNADSTAITACMMDPTHAIVCYSDIGFSNFGTASCLVVS